MKYNLSVLVPGIRTKNWKKLYDSIYESFNGTWEMVFIGPYELPKELKGRSNIKYIKDWGTPIRCQQKGLCVAEGDYITWAADDGYFTKDGLNEGFQLLNKKEYYWKRLVMGKYIEGNNDGDMSMQADKYYILSNHNATKRKFIPEGYFMLNVGIVPTVLLKEVGGWDCNFEVCPMAYNDLAVRLQNYRCDFIIQDKIMFKCSHMPGHMGDHGPIHDAQILHDEPLFKEIYDRIYGKERIKIDIDNWTRTPSCWLRRFGKPQEEKK